MGKTLRGGIVGALVLLAGAGSASAATIKVTETSDPVPGACTPSDCTLREAVRRANGTAANDRIVLKGRTYGLQQVNFDDDSTAGDLDVVAGSGRLQIVGKGRRKTKIDGNDVERVLQVLEGGRLKLSALTVTDGGTSGGGAGLYNLGSASLKNVAVRGNVAGSIGGGIWNAGTGRLQIARSLIAGNQGLVGGGIYAADQGRVAISRSAIAGNDSEGSGGGIYNQNDARMNLSRSTVAGNRSDDDGGGIYNQNDAILTIDRSTIAGNRTLSELGIAFARGGGIYNQNNAVLRVTNSTVTGNRSPSVGGGLITRNDSVATFTNSTISGNRADQGGGVYLENFATLKLRFSTVARNRASIAGGILEDNADMPDPMFDPLPPYVISRGTIVAKNVAGSDPNCQVNHPDYWDSLGSNLENGNACEFDRAGDERNATAGLKRLKKNGGPTKTHALKASSDAVNAAKRQGCPGRDQRGVKRPQGRRCDIGAYELKRRRR